MTAYYNEFDPRMAGWLRELIAAGLIAPGDVDERSIVDVQGTDLAGYRQCHFFAGVGVWSAALRLAGWPDDRRVWTGSCPCQPFSSAGRRKGTADERHLWPEFLRLIRECRPATVFGEQVEGAVRHGWLDGVFADLEGAGYACGAAVLGAHSVGAPHIRQRLWWVADAERARRTDAGPATRVDGVQSTDLPQRRDAGGGPADGGPVGRLGDADGAGLEVGRCQQRHDGTQFPPAERAGRQPGAWSNYSVVHCRDGKARRFESQPGPLADGVAALLDALRAAGVAEDEIAAACETFPLTTGRAGRAMLLSGYGNAIVPQVAAEFVRAYEEASND